MGKKIKSVQELKEHGEPMVKIAKGKGKTKQKVAVTKMIGKSKLSDLPFLDNKPAQGTRGAHKKKGGDDSKPMVHSDYFRRTRISGSAKQDLAIKHFKQNSEGDHTTTSARSCRKVQNI